MRLLFATLASRLPRSSPTNYAPPLAKMDVPKSCATIARKHSWLTPLLTPDTDGSSRLPTQPKKRTLRTGIVEEVITRPGVRNNGVIEVLDPEAERKKMEMAERFINGKRYKIPEKIIHLDFWKKIGQ